MKMQLPSSSSSCFVFNSTSATEAMDGRASPRKPRVCMLNKSWAEDILEVACLSKAIRASMGDMPFPSSMTWMTVFPTFLRITCICRAPASIAFSMSSFTTEAGRCTTSPAAIWLATESGNKWTISIKRLSLVKGRKSVIYLPDFWWKCRMLQWKVKSGSWKNERFVLSRYCCGWIFVSHTLAWTGPGRSGYIVHRRLLYPVRLLFFFPVLCGPLLPDPNNGAEDWIFCIPVF